MVAGTFCLLDAVEVKEKVILSRETLFAFQDFAVKLRKDACLLR